MSHLTRARRQTLARTCLAVPFLFTLACQEAETRAETDLGAVQRPVTSQLSVTLIDSGGFDYAKGAGGVRAILEHLG